MDKFDEKELIYQQMDLLEKSDSKFSHYSININTTANTMISKWHSFLFMKKKVGSLTLKQKLSFAVLLGMFVRLANYSL